MITPVFILGIHGRSGTNFLFQLMGLHPDVIPPRHKGEDFLVAYLHHLEAYEQSLVHRWEERWGGSAVKATELVRNLSDGLLRFLSPSDTHQSLGKTLVTKTPSTENIALFPKFFPDAKLVVITRDGRDVVESGVRSGFWPYEVGFQEWNQSARRLLAFKEAYRDIPDQLYIVKYEDLLSDLSQTLTGVLNYCGLSVEKFDWAAAASLPVFGSSTYRGDTKNLHWTPQAKSEKFKPTNRWEGWSYFLKSRYNWICGDSADKLGYPTVNIRSGFLAYLRNLGQDLIRILKNTFRPWIRPASPPLSKKIPQNG